MKVKGKLLSVDPKCQLYGGKRQMRKFYDLDDEYDVEDFLEECDEALEDYK